MYDREREREKERPIIRTMREETRNAESVSLSVSQYPHRT